MSALSDKHEPVPDAIDLTCRFLGAELDAVDRLLSRIIGSDSKLIREVGEYICHTNGKKIRPIITILTARSFGDGVGSPVEIAAALEAIHLATLLHDDVIDRAPMRRGKPSVNARWGDDVAILMADFLFASAFDLAVDYLDPEPLRLICRVTRNMCEGEMFQIEHRGGWLTPEDYLHIISSKTAQLFSACSALGGIISRLPAAALAKITAFGMAFGMAFQITDDTLDYTAYDGKWGKSVGIDLAGGKQTLPLILTLKDATPGDRERIERMLNDGEDFNAVLEILDRYGSINKSLELARDYARQSRDCLDGMAVVDPVAFDLLIGLSRYVVERSY